MTNVCQTHYQWRSRRMPLLLCWQASPLHLMRIQLEWNWLSPICDWSRVCIHSAQSLLGVAGHLSFQTLSLSISIMTHQLCLMLKYQLTATTSLCNKCCIFSFWWNPRVHAEAHTCTDSDARPCMLPEGSVRTSNESRVVSPVVVWQLLSLVHERLTGKFYYTFFKSKGPVCVNVFSPDTLACTHTHTQTHTDTHSHTHMHNFSQERKLPGCEDSDRSITNLLIRAHVYMQVWVCVHCSDIESYLSRFCHSYCLHAFMTPTLLLNSACVETRMHWMLSEKADPVLS